MQADGGGPGDSGFPSLLRVCEGFRVVTPGGRLGLVERVERSADGKPQALLVRRDIFRHRLIDVPIEAIDWIAPVGRRVIVGHPSARTVA